MMRDPGRSGRWTLVLAALAVLAWSGADAATKPKFVLTSTALFALGHYSLQGISGVEQAMITGLLFGTIVAVTGRIWIPMVAHAAFDLTALAMIYWSLESAVAHAIFE